MDGGERLDEGPAALNSVLERPHADGRARPLEEIFPLRGDADRAHVMQETWRAFADGMTGSVAKAFGDGRSPPEIAYAVGEVVHNFFRTRGVTLTSYELRRLVAELLVQRPARAPLADERSARAVCQRAREQAGAVDRRRRRHAAASGCRCGVRGSAVASGIRGTARSRRGGRQSSRPAHERSVRPATQGRDRRHRIGAGGLAARRARSSRPAGLERALRSGADRPPVGRPFDPRGVRERAGRRLRRARGRHRTVAGKVSRWRSSRGDRWPPGEAGGLAGGRPSACATAAKAWSCFRRRRRRVPS